VIHLFLAFTVLTFPTKPLPNQYSYKETTALAPFARLVKDVKVVKPLPELHTEPIAEVAPKAEPVAVPVAPAAQAPLNGCGDNFYAIYVYMHESSCRTDAVNSIGCSGIGQKCGVLPCSLSDYVCQNNYFTNYAISRYGSWEAAYNFWVSARWW